jgi:hypothetical protein
MGDVKCPVCMKMIMEAKEAEKLLHKRTVINGGVVLEKIA